MKNKIFQNWALKLTSVVVSIVIWVIIYNINDPEESKRLYNVPVVFVNEEVIADNEQVYQVLNGTDVVRSITMHSTRSIIDSLKESDINVEADFKKLKMDGTIELKIYSNRHNDAISFTSSSNEVQLQVEDKISRYMALQLNQIGEPAKGYIIGSHSLGQNQIKISGAESVVKSVLKATAVVDMTGASDTIVSYADVILVDADGKEIPKEKTDLSVKSVIATVEVLATKTVPIIYTATGEAAEGYVATGNSVSEATEIIIAGEKEVLAPITEINISGEDITIEGATADVIMAVDLDDYLPQGVIRANKQGQGIVEVTFTIAPIVNEERVIRSGEVNITNVPEGYAVNLVSRSDEITFVLNGPDYLLENLRPSDIKASFDVAAWLEQEGISELSDNGSYMITPAYEVGEGIEVVESASIEIVTTKLEE